MPPMPSIGRIATARTIIPMPPSHCSCWRYQRIDFGRYSRPVITVAPVVVQPDRDSKKASAKLRPGFSASIKGKVPASPSVSQKRAATINPSLVLSSFLTPRNGNQLKKPIPRTRDIATLKASVAPSLYHMDTTIGGSMVRLNNIRKMPSTRAITVKCISEEAQAHLEESFHIGDVAFIHHKQNHVVIRFNHDIRASHNDVIAANDGTNCRARR